MKLLEDTSRLDGWIIDVQEDACYHTSISLNAGPRVRLGAAQNLDSQRNDFKHWFQPFRCWRWSAVSLIVLPYVELHLRWSSLDASPLAGTAESPNLELSEVDGPDGAKDP